jgi:hypothetical protein
MKPVYFLHVPRSGGTAIVHNLISLLGKPSYNHKNGNPVTTDGKWIPFWNFTAKEQLELLGSSGFICNERRLGDSFFPDFVKYVICLRDPVQHRLSLVSYALSTNFKEIKQVPPDLIHQTFEESYRRFPANYITWMLASKSVFRNVTDLGLEVALERLSHFFILRLDNIAEDFKRCMDADFLTDRGKHASRLKLTLNDLLLEDREKLINSTQLDRSLLSSFNIPCFQ